MKVVQITIIHLTSLQEQNLMHYSRPMNQQPRSVCGTPLHNLTVRHRLPRYNHDGFNRLRDYTSANATKRFVFVCTIPLCQRDNVILSPKTAPNSQSYATDDLPDLSKSMTLPGFDFTDDPKEKGLEHPAFHLLDRYSSVILNHQTEADKSSTSAITINQTAVLIFYVSREV